MSGLFATLNNTVKAISAQSRGLEVAGKNLANVNSPNYARERVVLGDRGTVVTGQGVESLGVEALSTEQLRSDLMDRQVLRQISVSNSSTAEQSGLTRGQAALGQSIDRTSSAADTSAGGDSGLGGAIDDFFTAFSGFASNPTDASERQALMQKASTLTDRFQLTDQRLADVQTDLTSSIGNDVTSANNLLKDIATLNKQIGEIEFGNPGSALDLRDARQGKLEELAALVPIEVRPGTGGQVQVVSLNGSGADVPLVTQSAVQGTIAFSGTQITAGSPATVLAMASGSIKGSLDARDVGVKSIRDNLNAIASQLVTSVNAAYNPTSTAGADFFVATGTAAATLKVTSTITPINLKASNGGAAGDSTVAQAIAQLASKSFSVSGGDHIEGTFSDFFSAGASQLGSQLADANTAVDSQASIEKVVRSQRDALSGVSIDEEMADLMKYQRAFQASSRVFNIIDELMDGVVNGLGHV